MGDLASRQRSTRNEIPQNARGSRGDPTRPKRAVSTIALFSLLQQFCLVFVGFDAGGELGDDGEEVADDAVVGEVE
ncbi:hypothetical protein, partial [Streptomyces albipurpureus]